MEKTLYHNISYRGISALENKLLSAVSSSNLVVFGVSEVKRLTGLNSISAHNTLAALAKKKLIVKLLKNKYCLREYLLENKFAVATNVFIPSYISFWSALSFYGFTEQQINAVQIASTKQLKKIESVEIIIFPIKLNSKIFFGYVKENNFTIASKEKALLDSAMNFGNVGGFNEFVKCLNNAWSEINKEEFVESLLRLNNKSLCSRFGYLFEKLKLPLESNLLKKIERKSSKSFIKLNPLNSKTNKYDKKWKIIINDLVSKEAIL